MASRMTSHLRAMSWPLCCYLSLLKRFGDRWMLAEWVGKIGMDPDPEYRELLSSATCDWLNEGPQWLR